MFANDAPAVKPSLLALDAALSQLFAAVRTLHETEIVSTLHANGRILAQAVHGSLNVPPTGNAQTNGYAVCATNIIAPDMRLKVAQRVPVGHVGQPLNAGETARTLTGALIPPSVDAVVIQEQREADPDSDTVTIDRVSESSEWIRRTGENIADGAEILPRGIRLDPQQLDLVVSAGCANLHVVCRPHAAVFFTDDELATPGEPLKPGAIYNSNRFTLRTLLEDLGCGIIDFGIVPDTLQVTRDTLCEAAEVHDLTITPRDVSAGEEDHIKSVVEAGGRLDPWQIAIKSGKPLAFGEMRQPEGMAGGPITFLTGLPGNSVSSFATFLLFVRPFILRLQDIQDVAPECVPMHVDFALPKSDCRSKLLHVRINTGDGLDLFPDQSSGVLTSTVWGDGLIDNPPSQPIAPSDVADFLPFVGLV